MEAESIRMTNTIVDDTQTLMSIREEQKPRESRMSPIHVGTRPTRQ